ncbi:HalD/BesD family halogenase [Nocardia sp. NBC_00403]|uniref:HalD/BesD family halogenase n=1 Tax=Nocardia sp. NBC_00403 TaxID=2975990 RepID=UPI002E1FC626
MAGSESVVETLVNIDRYPLDDLEGRSCRDVVEHARRHLTEDGCCVLPQFIRGSVLEALRSECVDLIPGADHVSEVVNVYKTEPDASLPTDHPARFMMERGNAFVARDRIPAASVIHRLYGDEMFQHFIARCFGLPRVYELADPLAGLCLNVVAPGMSHPWHFDINEFAVSMVTQRADDGGEFDYCPNIRSASHENIDDVREVLTGRDRGLVRSLTLQVGDLQLFRGRYSLHRIREVRGDHERLSAIFAYSGQADVIGSPDRTRLLFGRVTPQHDKDSSAAHPDGLLG